ALRAEGHARYTRGAIFREASTLDGARIGFQRDFDVAREAERSARVFDQPADGSGREQAGRASTEKNADQLAPGDLRRLHVEIAQQRLDVPLFWQLVAYLVRIEIAVRTFLHAPRKVGIQR